MLPKIVTALPSSPVDGDFIQLQLPGVNAAWLLVYRAVDARWDYIGAVREGGLND